jgi:hypothetical protein
MSWKASSPPGDVALNSSDIEQIRFRDVARLAFHPEMRSQFRERQYSPWADDSATRITAIHDQDQRLSPSSRIAPGQRFSRGENMTLRYLAIIVLTVVALLVICFKFLKPGKQATRWAVKARPPVSPVEQQLFRRLVDAFPQCIILSQVAVSQLVSVVPGPGRQVAFNKISRLVADFVLCTAGFAVIAIIELDDSSHAAAHRKNADRNKSEALAAAGFSLVRFQASKLPTVAELRAALPLPDSKIVAMAARKQGASDSRNTK